MPQTELFWLIFTDTFTTNLAFIINNEMAIWVAPKLTNLPKETILQIAFASVFCSSICNYLFGIVISNIFGKVTRGNNQASQNIGIVKDSFDNFGLLILVIGFIPVYSKLVVVFAGFCRYKIIRVLVIVSIVKTLFYAYFQ